MLHIKFQDHMTCISEEDFDNIFNIRKWPS